jgi:hypothetical protein
MLEYQKSEHIAISYNPKCHERLVMISELSISNTVRHQIKTTLPIYIIITVNGTLSTKRQTKHTQYSFP